jgi:hypothetical protein
VEKWTPFGLGHSETLAAFKLPPPDREKLTDDALADFVRRTVSALDSSVSDRKRPHYSPTVTVVEQADRSLRQQGIRLLLLERIMLDRKIAALPAVQDWLRVIKMSPSIIVELSDAGISLK